MKLFGGRFTGTACVVALCLLLAGAGVAAGCAAGSPLGGPDRPPRPVPVADLPAAVQRTAVTASGPLTCADYRIPVTLPATGPAVYRVRAQLCATGGFTGKPVQELLPDGGYTGAYWNWPWRPDRYSWVRAAARAGNVTLAVDPLGAGGSDHPAGGLLDYAAQASVAHQLVTALRAGALGVTYRRVVLVGQGLGGYTAWQEAGTWRDVDALVLVGAAHTAHPNGGAGTSGSDVAGGAGSRLVDAGADARFRAADLSWAASGYRAIPAGGRCAAGYHRAGVEGPVCAEDERANATVAIPDGMVTGQAAVLASAVTTRVRARVLLVAGDDDAALCGRRACSGLRSPSGEPLRGECSRWFPAAAWCGAFFEPDAGHNAVLHRAAAPLFTRVDGWLHQALDGTPPRAA
jgi:hypothetical protein